MDVPHGTSRKLDKTLAQPNREHVLEIELDDLADLLVEPDTESFVRPPGPSYAGFRPSTPGQAGVDNLAATLAAAKALPDQLTVRVILPEGASPDVPVAEAQAALRSLAADRAYVVWCDATAIRNTGRRLLPLGLVGAFLSLVGAYAVAAAATEANKPKADSSLFEVGALVFAAGLLLMIAWVVSWVVIEFGYFDWRPDGRKASAYELIAGCTLEIA